MTKKLTPAEAWEHVRAVLPVAKGLFKRRDRFNSDFLRFDNNQFVEMLCVEIDWPEGVYQWPPPIPEPVYETPNFPDDWGKECEFSNDQQLWETYILARHCNLLPQPWVTHHGTRWKHCRIARDPAQDKTPPEPSFVEVSFPKRENDAKQENKPWPPIPTAEEIERACEQRFHGIDDEPLWSRMSEENRPVYRAAATKWFRAWCLSLIPGIAERAGDA